MRSKRRVYRDHHHYLRPPRASSFASMPRRSDIFLIQRRESSGRLGQKAYASHISPPGPHHNHMLDKPATARAHKQRSRRLGSQEDFPAKGRTLMNRTRVRHSCSRGHGGDGGDRCRKTLPRDAVMEIATRGLLLPEEFGQRNRRSPSKPPLTRGLGTSLHPP